MNKIFTFYAHARCDGCLEEYGEGHSLPPLSVFAVITAEDTPTRSWFIAFKQFCSEECRDSYVEELNSINGGFLAFGYEVVKEGA